MTLQEGQSVAQECTIEKKRRQGTDKNVCISHTYTGLLRTWPIACTVLFGYCYGMSQNALSKPLSVLVTMDVEEEGLFSGRYRRRNPGVSNIASLPRLARLSDELGFPLTLLCAHAVFTNPDACRVLEVMRDRHGAEIGAHLHHWSTPPFESEEEYCTGTPERTHAMDQELLEARLVSLLEAGRAFQGQPLTSFRMGRWDLKSPLFPMLQRNGIVADSSICPLRAYKNGADHFLAPHTPYWALGRTTPFLEIPITQIPLLTWLPGLWDRLFKGTGPDTDRRDNFHFLAALSASPFWHKDPIMRLCVRLLRMRGEDVLCVFWHSTEIVPGCSPQVPDKQAADQVLERIFSFFTWLREHVAVRGMTMTQFFASAWQDGADNAPGQGLVWPEKAELGPVRGDW